MQNVLGLIVVGRDGWFALTCLADTSLKLKVVAEHL